MAGPIREPDASTSTDTLNAAAVSDLDRLLEAAAALRTQLRQFEAALRKVRGFLDRGGAASDLSDLLDIVTAREGLTRAATDFQTIRHTSRLSVFRAQAADGMSVGAIARDWGLSRQLVSRMLRDAEPKP